LQISRSIPAIRCRVNRARRSRHDRRDAIATLNVFVGTNLLNVLDRRCRRANDLVLTEYEIGAIVLGVSTLRESETVVRGVVLEASLLERDR